ncbi:MAG: AAA family ATPase [Acidobacteria bacterium]|nr:AAA family ATPase [Acidobacteriota bacterium]
MIVAFEGAPGVGKSTTATALADLGAFVIPEANLLFARPTPEPADWYLDRQNVRWEMAALQARQERLAILDGDPFQPLWFGWVFRAGPWVGWRDALQFYRQRILDGRLAFPDRYVFFTLPEPQRRQRLLARERARGFGEERAQQKAERYAPLVEPQRQYFDALTTRFPDWVVTLEPTSLEHSAAIIQALRPPETPPPASLEILEFIGRWMGENETATSDRK